MFQKSISCPDGTRSAAAERLLTITEVAERAGIGKAQVFMHASGRREPVLPVERIGRLVRFREQDVDAFIETLEAARSRRVP